MLDGDHRWLVPHNFWSRVLGGSIAIQVCRPPVPEALDSRCGKRSVSDFFFPLTHLSLSTDDDVVHPLSASPQLSFRS